MDGYWCLWMLLVPMDANGWLLVPMDVNLRLLDIIDIK